MKFFASTFFAYLILGDAPSFAVAVPSKPLKHATGSSQSQMNPPPARPATTQFISRDADLAKDKYPWVGTVDVQTEYGRGYGTGTIHPTKPCVVITAKHVLDRTTGHEFSITGEKTKIVSFTNAPQGDLAIAILDSQYELGDAPRYKLSSRPLVKGEKVTVVGNGPGGGFSEKPEISETRFAEMTLAADSEGNKLLELKPIAKGRSLGTGICHGDSGGPVFSGDGNLIGVVEGGVAGFPPWPWCVRTKETKERSRTNGYGCKEEGNGFKSREGGCLDSSTGKLWRSLRQGYYTLAVIKGISGSEAKLGSQEEARLFCEAMGMGEDVFDKAKKFLDQSDNWPPEIKKLVLRELENIYLHTPKGEKWELPSAADITGLGGKEGDHSNHLHFSPVFVQDLKLVWTREKGEKGSLSVAANSGRIVELPASPSQDCDLNAYHSFQPIGQNLEWLNKQLEKISCEDKPKIKLPQRKTANDDA